MKIIIICPDFQKSNIRKLPWKYVYEIAKYLSKKHKVTVITDSDKMDLDEIKIVSLKRLFIPLIGETEELLNIIKKENPDKCIMLLGLSSFLRKDFKIDKSVIGIFTSPIYSINDLITNVGIKNSVKYRKYTFIHYLNALIPGYLVRKWGNKFDQLIFLSKDTQKKLIQAGLPPEKAFFLPPSVDDEFFLSPKHEDVDKIKIRINPENVPVIMYFTSPLTLRGTDILVKAFSRVRKRMTCKLVFLSRIDHNELLKEEEILNKIATREGINDSIEIISTYLSLEQIKGYLATSNVVCLPFKIVLSDIPVSILEAMALEKPVISTNVGCIPEILEKNGITVNPNDPNDLADSLKQLLTNKDLANKMGNKSGKYMQNYPKWDEIAEKFIEIVENNHCNV
ncbi:glycosyltransferase family 4 protein [uncultured Methanobacterium sp.]|uniref:glycosyltransferase family 4 protein n=1 Tax=uncultured Methanobacterium sp. TaxID=176306 RepID=UPI002AA87E07|nr:glycosyltransferase family 4 protein [uncultured Methanobacterium sp.]